MGWILETCKLCCIDPEVYLADMLAKIVNGHPNCRIDDLLPWAYDKPLLRDGV